MQRILCPQCGAPVEFKSAASVMAVCGACRSTLLKDAQSVKRIGEVADVLEDYSPVQIGSAGTYQNKRFQVVGRLQLRYDAGFWNEWYVWFDDGQDGWLSDASGQYAITVKRPASKPSQGQARDKTPQWPPFDVLTPGSTLRLDGEVYYASDICRCRAVTGQGELPFAIGEHGYEAIVADFRAQGDFLTLDYSDAPLPVVYQGTAYSLNDMQRASLRAEHLIESSAGNYVGAIKSLACPHCGASVSFAAAVATQVVCPSCRSQVDCSGDTAEVIAKHKQVAALKTTLALGAKANIDGTLYTLIGLLQCAEIEVGLTMSRDSGSSSTERSQWFEYLLYSPQQGFLWLVESDDGWDRVHVCDRWPLRVSSTCYALNSKRYTRLNDYGAKVKVALGAFNWRVQVGDVTYITDFGTNRKKLTREMAAAELGWSASQRVQAAQVAKWFDLPELLAADTDKKTKTDKDSLKSTAFFACIAMLFFNADAMEDSRFLLLILGAAALWLPIWVRSLFPKD